MFNLPVMAFASNDALDAAEIEALSKAIDAQCKQSPAFRKYVTMALEITSGGQLVGVLGIIGARRLSRHGILLPKEADAMLGTMLGSVPTVDAKDAPSPDIMETGNMGTD
jgi:hypothetical protein